MFIFVQIILYIKKLDSLFKYQIELICSSLPLFIGEN
jgi:hypothetical protein